MNQSFTGQHLIRSGNMANDFKEIVELPEFKKDLKRLSKRFPTIGEDIQNFISTQLVMFHKLGLDNNGIFRLTDLGFDVPPVFKAKKFACRSLKGKGVMSGIRVIYAFYPDTNRIKLIEIYYKGIKENEDRSRMNKISSGSF
jgi:mRNA-degrading endonuclease RelE of RelBE toxin-antitoxin system